MNLSDKKILSKYRGTNLILDLNDITKFEGNYKEHIIFEHEVGNFLFVLGLILLIVPLFISFLNGNLTIMEFIFPKSFLNIIPYFSFLFIIYGKYLLRNRNTFEESLIKKNLIKDFQKINEDKLPNLYINQYFNNTIRIVIDTSINSTNNNFIISCIDELVELKSINLILENRLGINTQEFMLEIHKYTYLHEFKFETTYQNFFLELFDEAIKIKSEQIDEYTLFFVLNKYYLSKIYFNFGINELELEGIKIWYLNEREKQRYYKTWKILSKLKPTGDVNKSFTSKATHTIDEYGQDYTKIAAKGEFITSIGRDKEMAQLLEILQKQKGRAAIVLGEPGVGKTRFIKYLATKMTVEDVPKSLYDLRLIVIDLNKMLAQHSSIESFKFNLNKIFEEIEESKNIIMCFEDFTEVLTLKEDYKMEVVNLIINSIDKLNLKIIVTSNNNDYVKFIEPIKALAAIFEKVYINPPASNISLQILSDEIPELEKRYELNIQIDSLKRIVDYASKFDFERVMPDKGIDLLEEVCINANQKNLKFVNIAIVDELLSKKIGVNIGEITSTESNLLLNLDKELHKRVIGQEEAVSSVSHAIKRSRAGLTNSTKPIASFLFYGPTGVGKTEVAKAVAETYYGSEKLMIRVDMSEYQEESNLDRLIGYTDQEGRFIGGFLTEQVRTKPFSIVLLDEIEKANKKVLDLFLQVLDEGFLNDGVQRKIDFTNTIIVMTSNIGSKKIAELVLKGDKYVEVSRKALIELKDFFRIEFLNRFDKLIMFTPLTKMELIKIVELLLIQIKEDMLLKGISILWNDLTLSTLANQGYNPSYGARELKRVVNEEIKDQLANYIVNGKVKSGTEVIFNGSKIVNIIN